MKKRLHHVGIFAMFIVLALTLLGCATTSPGTATSPRDLMLSAGFKQDVADQPGEIKHLQKVPGEKMLCYQREGQKCYAFKDPATNSMYIGDEAAFKRYLDRAIQERLDQKYHSPSLMENDPEFWNQWVDKSGGG